MTGGEWHHEAAARHFVRAYRDGELGLVTLDDVPAEAAAPAPQPQPGVPP